MLKPKIIQLPDYSEYIGKEFILTADSDMTKSIGRPMLKGVRFVIKNIKNSKVTIKITNSKKELEELGMLDYDFNRVINDTKKEIRILRKIYQMWEDEPEKFIINEENYWNTDMGDGRGRGHCINTEYYGIPSNHPDKYGMAKAHYTDKGEYINSDTIMTLNYKRTDDKKNIYSYQSGKNEYYSKECYGFMIKGQEIELQDWEKRIDYYKKWVFEWILKKKEISIKTLNKMNFELYR